MVRICVVKDFEKMIVIPFIRTRYTAVAAMSEIHRKDYMRGKYFENRIG